jgi:DeoR/GlpR family transcriptional regulator of sugar metabolism
VTASDKVISLATSNKLGLRQSHSVCKPTEINTLVTELDPSDEKLLRYVETGIQLL